MCGRFTLAADVEQIVEEFGITGLDYEHTPRYNAAPAQTIAVVREVNGTRTLQGFRWGLVPHWAKDVKIGYKMINARSETLKDKPAFRNLLASNRILIPADGFYEWKTDEDGKQPYRFQLKDKSIYGFAGLFDTWHSPEGELLYSCTIITTGANETVTPVHDRMPVLLKGESADAWLNRSTQNIEELLQPYPAEDMTAYPVARAVGNVKNNSPSLIEKIVVPSNSK